MSTPSETQVRIPKRLPAAVGWLLSGELILAGIALALLPGCGRCGSGSWTHAAIAGAGALGYAGLIVLYRKGSSTLVAAGVLAAGGVHAALSGMMIAGGSFCIACALAAIVALLNAALVLARVPGSARWIPRALVPSFSLAWIVLFLALQAEAAETARHRKAAARELSTQSGTPFPGAGTRPVLTVFEMEGCHYCREFRTAYAPRLAREFPDLEVVYRKAEDVLWVRRTPTFALGENVLFEGLPTEYETLARAILGKPVHAPAQH